MYSRIGQFIQTLNEKEISCNYNFSASVNSWYSSLSFEYYWEYRLDHKQRIKIYKQWKAIYQWFITWLTVKADKSWKKQIIKCSWLLGLLAFIPYQDWTLNINPWVFIRNLFLVAPAGRVGQKRHRHNNKIPLGKLSPFNRRPLYHDAVGLGGVHLRRPPPPQRGSSPRPALRQRAPQ